VDGIACMKGNLHKIGYNIDIKTATDQFKEPFENYTEK